jgi:hypothetical protein
MCSFESEQILNNIRIYLPETIIKSGEIHKYIAFIENIGKECQPQTCLKNMPTRATNLQRGMCAMEQNNIIYEPGVPLHIPATLFAGDLKEGNIVLSKRNFAICLSAILNDAQKYNLPISQTMATQMEAQLENISIHSWSGTSYHGKVKKLVSAYLNRHAYCSSVKTDAVQLWYVDMIKPEYPSFCVGDVILEVFLPQEKNSIPTHIRVNEESAFVPTFNRDFQRNLLRTMETEKNVHLSAEMRKYYLSASMSTISNL